MCLAVLGMGISLDRGTNVPWYLTSRQASDMDRAYVDLCPAASDNPADVLRLLSATVSNVVRRLKNRACKPETSQIRWN
jgi:hypothetical protein